MEMPAVERRRGMKVIERCVSEKDDSEEWLLMSIEERQHTIKPMEWIPTSRELPTPNKVYDDVLVYYLVQNEYGDMMVATFIRFPGGARIWQQMYQDGAIMEDIVAWMPLPEPYRKVE